MGEPRVRDVQRDAGHQVGARSRGHKMHELQHQVLDREKETPLQVKFFNTSIDIKTEW